MALVDYFNSKTGGVAVQHHVSQRIGSRSAHDTAGRNAAGREKPSDRRWITAWRPRTQHALPTASYNEKAKTLNDKPKELKGRQGCHPFDKGRQTLRPERAAFPSHKGRQRRRPIPKSESLENSSRTDFAKMDAKGWFASDANPKSESTPTIRSNRHRQGRSISIPKLESSPRSTSARGWPMKDGGPFGGRGANRRSRSLAEGGAMTAPPHHTEFPLHIAIADLIRRAVATARRWTHCQNEIGIPLLA